MTHRSISKNPTVVGSQTDTADLQQLSTSRSTGATAARGHHTAAAPATRRAGLRPAAVQDRSVARRGVHRAYRTQSLGTKPSTTTCSDTFFHASDRSHDRRLSPNAIAYLRVSTEEQADSRLGLDAQRASLQGKAAQLGLPLGALFEDPAVCGATALDDRPVLMEAVTALRRGDVLLVAKRDRLSRDHLEAGLIERLVQKRGARVVSAAGEGTADDEPSSVFTRHVMDAVAELELSLIRARTKAGLTAKRARGERAGTVPYGYQLASDHPKEQRIEPAPVEQRLLAQMRASRAAGQTYEQIAAGLRAAGATTRKGTPWRFQYVARLLTHGRAR